MVIGLKYGLGDLEDTKAKADTNAKTLEMLNDFKAENGSILCRNLLEYDISYPDELSIIKEKKTVYHDLPNDGRLRR